MYELVTTGKFRKDVKRIKKRGLPLSELKKVLEKLVAGEPLEIKYREIGINAR